MNPQNYDLMDLALISSTSIKASARTRCIAFSLVNNYFTYKMNTFYRLNLKHHDNCPLSISFLQAGGWYGDI